MGSQILGMILIYSVLSTISSVLSQPAAVHDYTKTGETFFKEEDSYPKYKRHVEEAINDGCAIKISTIQPKIAKNTNGEMRTIVSTQNKYLDIKTCVSASGTCKTNKGLTAGQSAQCEQKYTVRKYLILNNDGNIAEDNLLFPYGCECQITSQ